MGKKTARQSGPQDAAKRKSTGVKNLIPVTMRSKEEARALSVKGGRNSGISRKLRKTLRDSLKAALSCPLPKDSPHYRQIKSQMSALGMDGSPIVQDIPIIGMILKASKAPSAFIAIRDTIGEKPVDAYEDMTPQSPIVLGVVPADVVEEAKRRHDGRQNEKRSEKQ